MTSEMVRPANRGSLVTLKSVQKEYCLGKTVVVALREITMTIEKGSFAAIAGPSGSGKTTLLNIIGCLDVPTSGSVSVAGRDLGDLFGRRAFAFSRSQTGIYLSELQFDSGSERL
jgi:ABC-type lipoprotein export system ATPase subunit